MDGKAVLFRSMQVAYISVYSIVKSHYKLKHFTVKRKMMTIWGVL